jgi:hypothetical protein
MFHNLLKNFVIFSISTVATQQSFPVSTIFTSTNGRQQQIFSTDNNFQQQWNHHPSVTFTSQNNQQMLFTQGEIIENNNNNGGGGGGNSSLPFDLESVNALPVDQNAFADLDVDAVLRHELAQGGQFELP